MAFQSSQTSVATTGVTPVSLPFPSSGGSSSDPVPYLIRNTDATNPVYLGGPIVTTATGFPLKAGESISLSIVDDSELFAVATGGAVVVAALTGRQ